jgi:hypothetical protein
MKNKFSDWSLELEWKICGLEIEGEVFLDAWDGSRPRD